MCSSVLSGLRSLGPRCNRAPKSADGSWPRSTMPRVDDGIGRAASASASCVPTLPPHKLHQRGGFGFGFALLDYHGGHLGTFREELAHWGTVLQVQRFPFARRGYSS